MSTLQENFNSGKNRSARASPLTTVQFHKHLLFNGHQLLCMSAIQENKNTVFQKIIPQCIITQAKIMEKGHWPSPLPAVRFCKQLLFSGWLPVTMMAAIKENNNSGKQQFKGLQPTTRKIIPQCIRIQAKIME